MKKTIQLLFMFLPVAAMLSCNNMDFKRTKTGVLYKIISSPNPKDSTAKPGDVVKFNVISKINDSVAYTSFGKMPEYMRVPAANEANYSPVEVLAFLRKGDSAMVVTLADSLIARGLASQMPPTIKKGDRFIAIFKVLEIFKNDSLGRLDYDAEMKKDEPRRQKEAAEQQVLAEKQRIETMQKEIAELKQNGEIDKELKAMEAYLASKKLTAQKTGMGVFVDIKLQGDGPKVDTGKMITVKYTGKRMDTDSVFESNTYSFVLGKGQVIEGWEQGLQLFNKGGKGTLYIPGFLAYGKNPGPGSPFKEFEPLKFDVEIMDVKDNPTPPAYQQ